MWLRLYLKILAIFYGIGFLLHLADIFNLRLKFWQMGWLWKGWISFLLVADLATAIGLWTNKRWGIRVFIGVAVIQLVAYLGFSKFFPWQGALILFHCATLTGYFLLHWWATRELSKG